MLELAGGVQALALTDGQGTRTGRVPAGRFRRAFLHDASGAVLDEVLVVGRDLQTELHLHGGASVSARILQHLEWAGFRHERPSSGAVPRSWRHARAVLSGRHGPMAVLCRSADAALECGHLSEELQLRLVEVLRLSSFADALAHPPLIRIVGPPNAGKSTLFNTLLGTARALVSPTPGTTRDAVLATWSLRGLPVRLQDTAGGARGREPKADLVVEVLAHPDSRALDQRALAVLGRADLHEADHELRVSAKTGEGIDELRQRMAEALEIPLAGDSDLLAPVEPRQRAVITAALALRRGRDRAPTPSSHPG